WLCRSRSGRGWSGGGTASWCRRHTRAGAKESGAYRRRSSRGCALVLHTLMDESDVRRADTWIDLEADADRIRGRRLRRRTVGIEDGDLPEDPDVLEPGRALDERTHVEPVCARRRRSFHGELEPGDLTRPDVLRGLHGDPVIARPSGRGRAEPAVPAQDAWLVLAGLAVPRAEVGRLAHPARDPAERARVVVRESRRCGIPRAQAHIPALAVPGGVESGK